MPKPRVLNKRNDPISKGAVFVGRPSRWGNPFRIGRDGSRTEVIRKYREWLLGNEELLAHLSELKGKDLYCFCLPLPCHAEVLLELANSQERSNVK